MDSVLEHELDMELVRVAKELQRLDPTGSRWSSVVRRTYDMIYNGHDTGRYRWDQLMKTEKTHFGTLFEINAQREFGFQGGDATDFEIAGVEVDAKWSQKLGGWMLPPEVFGKVALVATGDDAASEWSLGLISVTPDVLKAGTNRDAKKQLSASGLQNVHWLWKSAALRPNILLQLPRSEVDELCALKSGNAKVAQLFRIAQGQIVHRNAVATVARQLDPMKRIRGNGGARSALQPKGILILSGVYHRKLAEQLGIPVPLSDEFISIRVIDDPVGVAEIDGVRWRVATPADRVVPAPELPSGKY